MCAAGKIFPPGHVILGLDVLGSIASPSSNSVSPASTSDSPLQGLRLPGRLQSHKSTLYSDFFFKKKTRIICLSGRPKCPKSTCCTVTFSRHAMQQGTESYIVHVTGH